MTGAPFTRAPSAGGFEPRTYRSLAAGGRLASFQVVVGETDLMIRASREEREAARRLVCAQRESLEAYLREHPGFLHALSPWRAGGPAPAVVREMIAAAAAAGVGPMAAVAGAIAARVGCGLLERCEEVIVENGGDIFMKTAAPATVALYAGASPLSLRIGVVVGGGGEPAAVCTSSGTVGHSLSFGRADAACVVARSCALADAAATAIGNLVQSPRDLRRAIAYGRRIPGVEGMVIVAGEQMALWGAIELVPLALEKG
ncbi:MAG: UPF0280 family protein [Desulfobacterales bacterium]|jgi:hypothetical protein|nr:UPF0280 family protein [Desulfobacterales bacterium]